MDVGLALAFAGVSYLVWSLVAGFSRSLMQEFIYSVEASEVQMPNLTRVVKVFFVDAGFLIDLVGLAWMVVSLVLVLLSSRQKIGISWAWVSVACQAFIAALGAVLVGWVVYAPYMVAVEQDRSIFERVSEISLPVVIAIAVVIWTTFLVWLLVERARFNRHGPTMRDGLRSNVFKT